MIEHQLAVVSADWIMDLGPQGRRQACAERVEVDGEDCRDRYAGGCDEGGAVLYRPLPQAVAGA